MHHGENTLVGNPKSAQLYTAAAKSACLPPSFRRRDHASKRIDNQYSALFRFKV